MARRRPYVSPWCTNLFHQKCSYVAQKARTVVRNGAGGSSIIEIPEMLCTCNCHPKDADGES